MGKGKNKTTEHKNVFGSPLENSIDQQRKAGHVLCSDIVVPAFSCEDFHMSDAVTPEMIERIAFRQRMRTGVHVDYNPHTCDIPPGDIKK